MRYCVALALSCMDQTRSMASLTSLPKRLQVTRRLSSVSKRVQMTFTELSSAKAVLMVTMAIVSTSTARPMAATKTIQVMTSKKSPRATISTATISQSSHC